ncbi:MAG: KamA family radical SAM protein [Proteobacteria bacterium]|nr:KamA family radical SAM protein [Pseudomonadota bacterium]
MFNSSDIGAINVQLESDNDDEPPGSAVEVPLDDYHERSNLIIPSKRISPLISNTSKQLKSKSNTFRKTFYPGITNKEWNDWHWQVKNCITRPEHLKRFLTLTAEEDAYFARSMSELPLKITPYYMSLLCGLPFDHSLRKTVVPTIHEWFKSPCEENDPLNEDSQSPVHGLVHRYPDRVLLLVLDFCATYCRYCTRSRVVGKGSIHPKKSRLEMAIDYIRNTPAIRDVLLSGGDPLLLSDDRLEWILKQLRDIPHVEIIRIGTKVPSVLPQRITPKLVRMLKKYHPLWMSLHFVHPEECTDVSLKACKLLAEAGIPLGSQTVLLKGVNDSVETMKSLMHKLMQMRVRPYYLYQCDLVSGTSHFRTSVQQGMDIIRGLRGHTSGYAIPNYVIDAPGGGGKIPVMPNYIVEHEKDGLTLSNYANKRFYYPGSLDEVPGLEPTMEVHCV